MSFMAGFGQAFSRSFENSRERRLQEEQDIFKLTFNKYLENESERKKAEKADAENVKKAAALAEVVAPGVNKKAATAKAYEWVSAGLSDSEIQERLKTGSFSMEEKQTLEAQTEAVTAPGSSVQKEENLKKVQEAQGQSEAQPSWKDTFKGGLFGSPYSKRDSQIQKAQQKVADYTGSSVDQIRETMTGPGYQSGRLLDTAGVVFTPGADPAKAPKTAKEALLAAQDAYSKGDTSEGDRLRRVYDTYLQAMSDEERAKLQAGTSLRTGAPTKIFNPETRTWRITSAIAGPPDENGNETFFDAETGEPINPQLAQGIGEDEAKASEAIRKGLEKETISHASSQANFGNVLYSMDRVLEIGRNNPEALTHYTSSGASLLNNLRQEGVNLYNMGLEVFSSDMKKGIQTGKFQPNDLQKGKSAIQKGLETLEKDVERGKISRVAADAARIKMYSTLMSYEVAMAYGQEGRSLSDMDRKLFEEVVSDSIEPQRQLQALSELMAQLEGNLDRKAQNMFGDQSPMVSGFFTRYRYNPLGNVSLSVRDAVIANDPKLQQTYDFMMNSLSQRGVIQRDPTQPAQMQPAPGQMATPQGVQIPQRAIQALRENPDLIEQFKQKYGLDDAGIQTLLQGG